MERVRAPAKARARRCRRRGQLHCLGAVTQVARARSPGPTLLLLQPQEWLWYTYSPDYTRLASLYCTAPLTYQYLWRASQLTVLCWELLTICYFSCASSFIAALSMGNCKNCHKEVRNSKTHKCAKPTATKLLPCKQCSKQFSRASNLYQHINSAHESNKEFQVRGI